jgi:hypothetical protein
VFNETGTRRIQRIGTYRWPEPAERSRIKKWSGWRDLNARLLRPERSALPSWATSRHRYSITNSVQNVHHYFLSGGNCFRSPVPSLTRARLLQMRCGDNGQSLNLISKLRHLRRFGSIEVSALFNIVALSVLEDPGRLSIRSGKPQSGKPSCNLSSIMLF